MMCYLSIFAIVSVQLLSPWGQVLAFSTIKNGILSSVRKPLTYRRHADADTIILAATGRKRRSVTPTKGYDGPAFRVVRCFPTLSRREAERAVQDGRVRVDGKVVEPSRRLVGGETLTLDDRRVAWEGRALASLEGTVENVSASSAGRGKEEESSTSNNVYFKYNKPVGVACTFDKHDRRGLSYSLPSKMRKNSQRLFPVGRLDLDSDGLVLLTNDGRLADNLLQPKNRHEKEYVVSVHPSLSDEDINELADGVVISTVQQRGGQVTTARTEPCVVEEIVKGGVSGARHQMLRFVLCEGRNRQIRKMIDAVGSSVVSLTRVRHGVLSLGKLPLGAVAEIRGDERQALLESGRRRPSQSHHTNTHHHRKRRARRHST